MSAIITIGFLGVISLFVCIRQGPARAFLAVYVPVLLLLPDFEPFRWPMMGHLDFAEAVIIPIGFFMIPRLWREWRWTVADVLVLSLLYVLTYSEYINKNYADAQNLALRSTCDLLLPYVVAKVLFQREELRLEYAKKIVILLAIVAATSVYEFRMSTNPYQRVASLLTQIPSEMGVSRRYGFSRIAGPYGHAILAGMMMVVGYRLTRWLEWNRLWPGNFPGLQISKVRFCQMCIVAGSIMTICRGPWVGAAAAATVAAVGRARDRKWALFLLLAGLILIGPLAQWGSDAYVSVSRMEAATESQQTAAYRRDLLLYYVPLVEERPAWGYGRNNYPVMMGMSSVDNYYLLTALESGIYAVILFVLLLLWQCARLIKHVAQHPAEDRAASLSLTLLGIFIALGVSLATVWLGAQCYMTYYMLAGMTEALLLREAERTVRVEERLRLSKPLRFQSVVA